MGIYVSPGVYTREIDLSLYVPALSTTIVGMVGVTSKGPVNERTYITNQQQFVEVFGPPDSTVGFEAYAALQYLRQGRQLWFVRVTGAAAASATATFEYPIAVTNESQTETPALDGIVKSFTGTVAHANVKRVGFTLSTVMLGDIPGSVTDVTGQGVLISTPPGTHSGTINYETGAWTVTWGTAPKAVGDGGDIKATYSYLADAFDVSAISDGEWGNNISIGIEDGGEAGTSKLVVYYEGMAVERWNNIDLDDTAGNTKFIETVINGVSEYITVTLDAGFPAGSPLLPVNVSPPTELSGGDTDAASVVAADIIGEAWDDGLASPTGLQLFASPGAVDINLLAAPGWSDATVVNELLAICESRADCMAIIDPPEDLRPSEVVEWHNGQGTWLGQHAAFNSSYGALYWPWVKVYDAYNAQYVFTPPSGHVLAVYAYTDYATETWFAPAGVQRGRVKSGIDVAMGATPGETDLLYGDGNAVNPIVRFTKEGIVVWGQRTLQRTPTALDRVNVRRLLLYLRKVIATAARYLVFEPNDEKTWRLFGHLVVPYLNDVRQRRGLYDFRVKCDETTNTPAVIDRNELHAQIFLKPVKAAEFIQVDLVITSTGANFDEVLY